MLLEGVVIIYVCEAYRISQNVFPSRHFDVLSNPFFRNLLTLLNLHKLSSAAILSTAGNFLLNSAFHLHADPEPASRTTYAVLMSSKKSETAVKYLSLLELSLN